jgi:hypothetical protein
VKIPYINDRLNKKIKEIFTEENIPVRLVHKNKSLRNILSRSQTTDECQRENCQWKTSRICLRTGVVYKITCQYCHKHYIGSTIRVLHDRLREHTRDDKSAVYRHIQECHHGIRIEQNIGLTVRIIGQDKDNINLRFKESILIQQQRPQLNGREELIESGLIM